MKTRILIILLLYVNIVLFAQGTGEQNEGYQVFRYPNNAVSSEGVLKNGKPEGFWISYYVTGVKKSEGRYTNFMLDSVWVFYDQAGDTTEKINYLYGKKNGYNYKYKKDPSAGLYLWSRELYAGNVKEGNVYFYFPDGTIQQALFYKNGKREGLAREYDKDGNIITLFEYSNDFLISRQRINRTDNNRLKQGDWKEFYPGGGIKVEKTYRDDRLHGYYKEYDEKGRLSLTMLYDNGSIVKSRVEDEPDIEITNRYDQAGRLIYSGYFRNEIPVGVHREYGSDGRVSNSFIYNDNGLLLSEGVVNEAGNRNGSWKDLYEDGSLKAEGQYIENRRTGVWRFYNRAGAVEQTGNFNNDRPDGIWKWYYPDGSLLREEEYFQGQRDGAFVEYSPEGEIIASGNYTDGEKNGEWQYKSGDNFEEGRYIIGLKDGTWRSYYPGEKNRFRGSYIQGNPDGQHLYYYENGKIREEQHYRTGIRVKTWKKYDEEGNLFLTITYRDDIEISINGVRINLPERDIKLIK